MRMSRRLLLWTATARCAAPLSWSASGELNGYWEALQPPAALRTTAGELPPLMSDARALYEANQKARASGDLSFDTTVRCLPPGIPRLMTEPGPFEILQRDGYLYMLFQYQHLNREILFRDRHAPLTLGRRFLGDSIARWDADTLVIDTTGLKPGTLLDAVGLPHSKELHVVERYQLDKSGRELTDTVRIEDAKTYSQPWETVLHFRRLGNTQIKEDVCVDRQPGWFDALKKSEP